MQSPTSAGYYALSQQLNSLKQRTNDIKANVDLAMQPGLTNKLQSIFTPSSGISSIHMSPTRNSGPASYQTDVLEARRLERN